MRKLFDALFIALTTVTLAYGRSLNLDPAQCSAQTVSTTQATPTQVFTSDPAATRSYILNTSTNVIYVVGYSTTSALGVTQPATFSISVATGSFYLPAVAANTQPIPFFLDGATDNYTGPLWAVAAGSGGSVLLRCRTH